MKLYHKIIFLIIVIAGGIGLFSSLLASRIMHDTFDNELRKKAQIITRMMAENITHNVISNEVIPVVNTLQKIISNNIDVEYAYVVGFSSEVYAHSFEGDFPRDLAMQVHDEVPFDKPHIAHFSTSKGPILDISYPLIQGMSARVHLGMNETQAHKQVKRLRKRILITTLFLTLFGILLGILISRRITHPLGRLADSMQSFGKESRVQSFSFSGGSLEVKKLTTAFNRMISERVEMEESIRESEKKHRELLEGLDDAVYRMSLPDGKYEYFSRSAKSVFGYDSKQWLNNPKLISQIIHPDFIDYFKRKWADLIKGKVSKTYEYKIIDPKGNERWIFQSNTGIFNDTGKLTAIEGLCRNITEHKQAEEALRENEIRFRDITHSMADWIWEVDKNGKYIYVSDTEKNILGFLPEELIGKTPFELMPVKEAAKISEVFSEIVSKSRPIVELENWNIAKDGTEVCLLTNGVPILDSDGKLQGYRGVDKDITHQKKLEKKNIAIETQLRQAQKMEAIGTLAGGIAHDFNNILFPILGHTEMLLLEDMPEDNQLKDSLDEIYTAALRAKDLVKQILTFSRQTTNDLMLMKMQPIIKEALKLIRSTIPATIDIKQDISNDCGIIKADPTQIHQVIMNLTTNAYHAMEDTGGELKVSLKKIELGEYDIITPDMTPGVYACLTVADTGIGMDKDLIKDIFDPFFTTKENGKGTGIGLSVVYGIVNSMGGAIRVYSEPGKGTEFKVYFPVEKSSFEKQNSQAKEPIQGGAEQILLVDDEAGVIKMEKMMLERLGYIVTSRTSSIEAIEAFRGNPDKFDLVITDMAMPNLAGDKLSAELKKMRFDIPILLCTGFSETISEAKAASLGIRGFLMKPIVMRDLAKKIREVLDEKNEVAE